MRVSMLAIALLAAVLSGSVLSPVLAQQPKIAPAQDGFVPVDQLPQQEELPAARLVIIAYAVAWIAVFGYMWTIWQRLGRVEQDIVAISRRLEGEGRR